MNIHKVLAIVRTKDNSFNDMCYLFTMAGKYSAYPKIIVGVILVMNWNILLYLAAEFKAYKLEMMSKPCSFVLGINFQRGKTIESFYVHFQNVNLVEVNKKKYVWHFNNIKRII